MKKFVKTFLILPIIALIALFGVACEDNSLQSVSLVSITNISTQSSTPVPSVNGYYKLNMGDAFQVNINCTPNNYTAKDFSWYSSNTYSVVVNSNVLRAVNVGYATITFSYKNANGKVVRATFDVEVSASSPDITFIACSNNGDLEYTGNNLLTDTRLVFQCDQDLINTDETITYDYSYYNVTKRESTTEITDAGKYKITCKKLKNDAVIATATKDIQVLPKTITISAKPYSYVYGGGSASWPAQVVLAAEKEEALNTSGSIFNGVGREQSVSGGIGKSIEYVDSGVSQTSNVGRYNIHVYYQLNSVYQNNYIVTTQDGILNITPKTILVVPNAQPGLVYGQNVNLNNYTIYSYEVDDGGNWIGGEETFKDNTYKLDNSVVTYSNNFTINSPSYYIANKIGESEYEMGSATTLNNIGYLDVGSYFYKLNITVKNSNINIANGFTSVVNDEANNMYQMVEVAQRKVTICPAANQSKTYLQSDPQNIAYNFESGNFVGGDTLEQFLFVNYPDVDGEGKPISWGYNNYKVDVGQYFYYVDNTKNTNYDITLSNLAKHADGENDNTKIRFEVKKLTIYLEVSNVTDFYKVPNNEDKHTVSYVTNYVSDVETPSDIVANYRTRIKTLKIANKNIIDNYQDVSTTIFSNLGINRSSEFNTNGVFEIKYVETTEAPNHFKFSIELNELPEANIGSYKSYYLKPNIFCDLKEGNFEYTYLNSSVLNLNKIVVVIYPNEQATSLTKVFDGTSSSPNKFGLVDNEVCSYTYDFGEEELTVNDVFKIKSAGNVWNNFNSTIDTLFSVTMGEDVGNYLIKLNNDVKVKDEYAYFDVVLDSSKTYYVSVTPCTILVTPYNNQNKCYGANDPDDLMFSVKNIPLAVSGFDSLDTELPYEDISSIAKISNDKSGKLSRVLGENVGTYQITLGTLNFGNNYNVVLSNVAKTFEIKKRLIQITPTSYITTYGDDYPAEIAYEVKTMTVDENGDASPINNNIYIAPEKSDFSGAFNLGVYNELTGTYSVVNKVGNYYLAGSYTILRGSFNCSNNYDIRFVAAKSFIVNKKETVINFVAQEKTSTDSLPTTLANLQPNGYYSFTVLVDNPANNRVECNIEEVVLTPSTSVYRIDNTDDKLLNKIHFYKNGIDITSSYEIILGQDIVYTIEVTALDLVFVNKTNGQNNIQNVIYNGKTKVNTFNEYGNPDFDLVCTDSDYEIVVGSAATSFVLGYRLGGEVVSGAPINVGSYSVFINTSESGQIVVHNKKKSGAPGEYITFTLAEVVNKDLVENHVVNLSNIAYLNITKADIICAEGSLAFESAMEYGTNNISNLKTEDVFGNAIFKGVEITTGNYEAIALKQFTFKQNGSSLNYDFVETNDELRSLPVSERRPIAVTIEATSGNYNVLNKVVYLRVVPQNVLYTSANFAFPDSSRKFVYSGSGKTTTLSIENDSASALNGLEGKYQITYDYKKLQTTYNASTAALISYYNYNGGTVGNELMNTAMSTLGTISIVDFALNGNNITYTYRNMAFPFNTNQNDVPLNAGVYVCFATCVLNENYTFVYGGSGEYPTGSSITFATIFEIEKMGIGENGITIANWKNEFRYTTVFDFNNPSTLPFEYSVYPTTLQQVVTYEFNEELPVDNKLSVGTYSVRLVIDEDNYYCSSEQVFNVTKLEAQIVTPSILTYVYTGAPITSYLQGIGAALKNKDGQTETTEYYYSATNNFTIKRYKASDTIGAELLTDTTNAGQYRLEITYGVEEGIVEGVTKNYYGTGEYYFSIIPAPYTGTVTFVDSNMTYNPNFTAQTFFEAIVNNANVFNIDLTSSEYNLYMYYIDRDTERATAVVDGNGYNDEDFASYFKVGLIKLRIVVNFTESGGNTAQKTMEAWLQINPFEIADQAFLSHTTDNNSFVYNGYRMYQDLQLLPNAIPSVENSTWTGRLTPDSFDKNNVNSNSGDTRTITYGGYEYNVNCKKGNTAYNDYTYTIMDKLGNIIFDLKYNYYYYDVEDGYKAYTTFPIRPQMYKVGYTINVGSNYTQTFATNFKNEERGYSITKVNVLYITFSEETKSYDGTDYWNCYELQDCIVKNNSSASETNMKVTFAHSNKYDDSYNDEDGVCIVIYFGATPDTSTSVRDVGDYKIQVTMQKINNYHLSDFFNKIAVYRMGTSGETIYNVSDSSSLVQDDFREQDGTGFKYRNVCENKLHIKISVNLNNYGAVLSLNGQVTQKTRIVNEGQLNEYEETYLEIKKSTRVTSIVAGVQVDLCSINQMPQESLSNGFTFSSYNGSYYLRFSNKSGYECVYGTTYVLIEVVD